MDLLSAFSRRRAFPFNAPRPPSPSSTHPSDALRAEDLLFPQLWALVWQRLPGDDDKRSFIATCRCVAGGSGWDDHLAGDAPGSPGDDGPWTLACCTANSYTGVVPMCSCLAAGGGAVHHGWLYVARLHGPATGMAARACNGSCNVQLTCPGIVAYMCGPLAGLAPRGCDAAVLRARPAR